MGLAFGQRHWGRGVPLAELAFWFRCMAVLQESGMAITRTLEILAASTPSARLRELTEEVLARVQQGQALSGAFQKTGFPLRTHCLTLVRIGEESGQLLEVIGILAEMLEKEDGTRRRIRSALTYPAILAAASLALCAVLVLFIVPLFVELLEGLTAQLSPLSKLLFAVARWLADPMLWLILAQALALVVAEFLWWRRTPKGRAAIDRFMLRLPFVGRLVRASCMSRIAHVMALMVRCGCPQDSTLRSLVGVVDNQVVKDSLVEAERRVTYDGSTLEGALSDAEGFDSVFVSLAATGEESGKLDTLLLRAHEVYEEECERASAVITALVEPVILCLMGGIIGFVLIMFFLPISELNRAL